MASVLRKADNRLRTLSDEFVVLFAICSVFLHFTVSIVCLVLLFAYIIFYRTKKIFIHKSSMILIPISVVVVASAACNNNMLGLIVGIGLVAILFIMQYLRTVMTAELAEKAMKFACIMFLYTALYGIVEFLALHLLYIDNGHGGRSASVFFNPNYYGAVCAVMLTIALYKLFTGNMKSLVYYLTVLSAVIGLALCMSVFAMLEAMIAAAFLMYYTRHRYLLATYLVIIVLCCLVIYFVPTLMTRLADIFDTMSQRVRIWRLAFIEIPQAPFFGKGAMTYHLISPEFKGQVNFDVYVNHHAHNIVLDSLINYGFIGTALFIFFGSSICKKSIQKGIFKREKNISALIKSVAIGLVCHSMVDITFFWTQTGLLYAFIFALIGALDKIPLSSSIEVEHKTKIIE